MRQVSEPYRVLDYLAPQGLDFLGFSCRDRAFSIGCADPQGKKSFPRAWPGRSSPPPRVKRRRTGDDADCFCHRQKNVATISANGKRLFVWNADAKGSSASARGRTIRLRSRGSNREGSAPSLPAASSSTGFDQSSVGKRGRDGFDWRSRTSLKSQQAFCLNARGGSWR
jgi:hypothetical protein